MNTHRLVSLLACGLLTANAQAALSPPTVTNAPLGQNFQPMVHAPPFVRPPRIPPLTNATPRTNAHYLASTLEKKIKLTATGAEATFGRHKVRFQSDLAAARPI